MLACDFSSRLFRSISRNSRAFSIASGLSGEGLEQVDDFRRELARGPAPERKTAQHRPLAAAGREQRAQTRRRSRLLQRAGYAPSTRISGI